MNSLPGISPQSPELMSAADTALLVIDVQEKLVRLVPQHERLIWNIGRLIDGAQVLSVPVLGTEQYPQGLGPTTPALADKLGAMPGKMTFSCSGCEPLMQALRATGRTKVAICGIEAHVCVLQTALDLLSAGYRVYPVVDAIGARHEIDYTTALRRLETQGASLVTTEMALFEWCRAAGTPEFKTLSALVKEKAPG
jgi:nicotinamidase-related amidase